VAEELLLKRHEFQHLGSSYYEFRVVVRAYPKRHLLYDDAIDAASWGLWLAQGKGFSVELLDYPGQTTSVKFKELHDAVSMEIWRIASRHYPLPTISFGFPRSMESKVVSLDDALGAISGDLLLTLNVLLEYYKSESCDGGFSNRPNVITEGSTNKPHATIVEVDPVAKAVCLNNGACLPLVLPSGNYEVRA
jgi:hypothetical protein